MGDIIFRNEIDQFDIIGRCITDIRDTYGVYVFVAGIAAGNKGAIVIGSLFFGHLQRRFRYLYRPGFGGGGRVDPKIERCAIGQQRATLIADCVEHAGLVLYLQGLCIRIAVCIGYRAQFEGEGRVGDHHRAVRQRGISGGRKDSGATDVLQAGRQVVHDGYIALGALRHCEHEAVGYHFADQHGPFAAGTAVASFRGAGLVGSGDLLAERRAGDLGVEPSRRQTGKDCQIEKKRKEKNGLHVNMIFLFIYSSEK